MTIQAPSLDRPDVGSVEDWRAQLEHVRRRHAAILAREPRRVDGAYLFDCHAEAAALCAVIDGAESEMAQAIGLGAAAGAAGAIAAAASSGYALLREPGMATARRIPAGPAAMTPMIWRDALAMALIARDRDAAAVLLEPARIAACQMPDDRADAFWPSYCTAFAKVVSGAGDAAACVAEALDEIAPEVAEPGVIDALDRPLLELAGCLARGGAGWDAAVADTLRRHRDWWGADPARQRRRAGFIAIGVTGLAALAQDRGIATVVRSSYMPAGLMRREIVVPAAHVAFAPLSGTIAPPDEATEQEARLRALGLADSLKAMLRPLLLALRGPDRSTAIEALRPRPGDAQKAFASPFAAIAADVYGRFWETPPAFPGIDGAHSELRIHLAPAGMLGDDNMFSRAFPGGYRVLSPLLDPHRIWGAWDYARKGARDGLGFDGLVWCDDHWAWFPKPLSDAPPRDRARRRPLIAAPLAWSG